MKNYICVSGSFESQKIIERSRFISYAQKTESDEKAREFVEKIRKLHPFATHNCYAYIVEPGKVMRFSDDGEPQGTAGMPILEVLKNREIVDTTVVVTRYFGGVKLGAGGLVRAYSSGASEVLDASTFEEHVFSAIFKVKFSYDMYSHFLKFKDKYKNLVLSQEFESEVVITIAVPEENQKKFGEELCDCLVGKVAISRLNDDFVVFK